MRTGRKKNSTIDIAMSHLARLVVDETWTVHDAAVQLAGKVRHQPTLRQVRARIALSHGERLGPFGERALATLDAALTGDAAPLAPSAPTAGGSS